MASLALFIAIASPASSAAIVPESITPTEDVRSQQLLQRLEEIKGLDKSEMSRLEKKSLRKEVKEIKRNESAERWSLLVSWGNHYYHFIAHSYFIRPSFLQSLAENEQSNHLSTDH